MAITGSLTNHTHPELQITNNLNVNGYSKLPGGLLIQWGRVPKNGQQSRVITFPIPFKQVFTAVAQKADISNGNWTPTDGNQVTILTNTGFKANGFERDVNWIAIGTY